MAGKTASQKHAELKGLAKQTRANIYRMLQLADEILSDHEYVDKFGGETGLVELLEAEEFIHFGGDPTLSAMLRAYRAHPNEADWKEYRYNIRAMIELAHAKEDKNARERRRVERDEVMAKVSEVVADAARKHAGNVTKAVSTAEDATRKIKGFRDIVPELIRHALQERIYDIRHQENQDQRAANFSEASPYNYCLGGTVLGRLKAEQLEELAANEEIAATGHAFNARLCRALKERLATGKTVKQAMNETALQKLMDEVGQ